MIESSTPSIHTSVRERIRGFRKSDKPPEVGDGENGIETAVDRIQSLLDRSQKRRLGEVTVFTRMIFDKEQRVSIRRGFVIDFENPGRVVFLGNVLRVLQDITSLDRADERASRLLDWLPTTK